MTHCCPTRRSTERLLPGPARRKPRPHGGQQPREPQRDEGVHGRRPRRPDQHRGQEAHPVLPDPRGARRRLAQGVPGPRVPVLTSLVARARADRQLAAFVGLGAVAGLWLLIRAWEGAGSLSGFVQFTLIGLSGGCVFAIAASGLVLTYTTTGVFNFAHGAVGMIAAFVYHDLKAEAGLPTPVALAIVLLVLAPLVGLGLERTMRSFRGAAPGTTLTVTIALTILLIGVAQYLFQANGQQRTQIGRAHV